MNAKEEKKMGSLRFPTCGKLLLLLLFVSSVAGREYKVVNVYINFL